MKTRTRHLTVRNLQVHIAFMIFLLTMLLVSIFTKVNAQSVTPNLNDPHLSAKGKFMAGVITTWAGTIPPPVLIADATYGISNRVSLGIVAGTTGELALYGLKFNASLYEKNNFRVLYRMSSIYYPERNGRFLFDKADKHVMAWMLTMGLLDAEWRTTKGIRWSLGMGLLETHCIDGMMNYIFKRTPSADEEKDELPFDVFNTIQGSVSIPLSKRLTLRPEVITILKGTQFIHGDEHKVGPFNIYLRLSYTF